MSHKFISIMIVTMMLLGGLAILPPDASAHTPGSEYIFADADLVYGGANADIVSADRISDSQEIIAYGSGAYAYVVIATVSGTTISYGTPLALSTTRSPNSIDITVISSTHAIVTFSSFSSTYTWVYLVDFTGGTLTNHNSQSLSLTSCLTPHVARLTDSSFVLSYWQGSNLYTTVGTIAADVITLGSAQAVPNSNSFTYDAIAEYDSTTVALAFTSASIGRVLLVSISGTTATFNTQTVFNNAVCSNVALVKIGATGLLITYADGSPTGPGSAIYGSVSGTSITFSGAETPLGATGSQYRLAAISSTKAIVAFVDRVQVLHLSGSTISCEASVAFNSGTSDSISVDALTETSTIISFKDKGNGNKGTAIIVTGDTTTGTLTTALPLSANSKRLTQSSALWSTAYSAATGTVNPLNTIQCSGTSGPLYNFDRDIIVVDTSTIPANAVITAASLNLWATDHLGSQTFMLQAISGASNPPAAGDYLYSKFSGNYGTIAGSSVTNNAWFSVGLTSYDIITRGGISEFGFRQSNNDISNAAPTPVSWSYIQFAAPGDNGHAPYLSITYTVPDTPPTWAPSFTSSPPEIGQAGVSYSYTATLNETGTLAPVTLPAWATMTGSTVSGTPLAAGTYAFIIEGTSTAGTLSTRQYWNATIEAATPTWAPSWTSSPQLEMYLGDTYTYTPTLNETATLEAIELPVWAGLVDGAVIGLPNEIGTYTFTLRATSTAGTLTADQTWQVNVTDAPIPVPQLLNQPQENGTERVWYSWTPSMSLSCSFTLNSTAGWLRIHPYTGEIYGLPSSGGLYLVVIEATSLDYATTSTLVYNLTIEEVLYQPGDEVVDDDPPATPGNSDLGTIGGVPVLYIGVAIILMLFIIVVLALASRRR